MRDFFKLVDFIFFFHWNTKLMHDYAPGLCLHFAGMKVNGGSSRQDWLFVNFSNPDSLIGTSQIWRSKIDPCTVTSSICSGSPDDYYLLILTDYIFSYLVFCLGKGKLFVYHMVLVIGTTISPHTASSFTLITTRAEIVNSLLSLNKKIQRNRFKKVKRRKRKKKKERGINNCNQIHLFFYFFFIFP